MYMYISTNTIHMFIFNFYETIFFLSFRQNYRYSTQCTCIHRYLQDQRMQAKHVNFHKIYVRHDML